MFAGNDILVDAANASALRTRVEDCLDRSAEVVVLDFAGVNGVSNDFADALLGPLFDLLGDALSEKVLLDNCSASVLADLRCLAEMHRPVEISPRPSAAKRGRQAA